MEMLDFCIFADFFKGIYVFLKNLGFKLTNKHMGANPMAETVQHSDIVADTEYVLQTVFVLKNCLQHSE